MGVCIKTLSAIIFRRVLCVLQFRTIDLTGLFSHTILKISCIDCNLWDSCLLPCRPHDGSHPHLQCLVSCRQGDDRFRSHGNPHGGDQDWARLFAKLGTHSVNSRSFPWGSKVNTASAILEKVPHPRGDTENVATGWPQSHIICWHVRGDCDQRGDVCVLRIRLSAQEL